MDGITSVSVEIMCNDCTDLTSINLYGCGGVGVSDDNYTMMHTLTRLKYLNLTGTYVNEFIVGHILRSLLLHYQTRTTPSVDPRIGEPLLELVLEDRRFGNPQERARLLDEFGAHVRFSYIPFPRLLPAWGF